MTKQDDLRQILRVLKHCPYCNTGFRGKDRTRRYDICRMVCKPCHKAIIDGQCCRLDELREKQNKESER